MAELAPPTRTMTSSSKMKGTAPAMAAERRSASADSWPRWRSETTPLANAAPMTA